MRGAGRGPARLRSAHRHAGWRAGWRGGAPPTPHPRPTHAPPTPHPRTRPAHRLCSPAHLLTCYLGMHVHAHAHAHAHTAHAHAHTCTRMHTHAHAHARTRTRTRTCTCTGAPRRLQDATAEPGGRALALHEALPGGIRAAAGLARVTTRRPSVWRSGRLWCETKAGARRSDGRPCADPGSQPG